MAAALYRPGGWTFDHRRAVPDIWLSVLSGLGRLAAGVGHMSNSSTVPGTESQQALDLRERKFPETDGALARIVFAAPPGDTLNEPQHRSLIAPTVKAARRGSAAPRPEWIDRRVPQLDVAGEQLEEQASAPERAPEPAPEPVADPVRPG
jgi:putative drug exporter of the RND superfamily